MAEKKKKKKPEEEARVPVLTVLKNSAILKNIFIVLDHDNEDQTVLIGRHPDCNIVLTHPSVSRFHLRIRSNPSSQTLSLVDLASVHGTWVRGRKLEPGLSQELKEGDTFTLGVSTRLYRLCWLPLPLTQFDVFVPQQQQKYFEQGGISKDENLEHTVEHESPVAEGIVSLCCDEEGKSHSEDETFGVLNGTETPCFPTNSGSENILCDSQNRVLLPPYVQSVDELDNTKKIEACPELEMPGETNLFCTLREYLTHNICLPVVEAIQGTKMQQFQAPHDAFTGQLPSLEMLWSSLPANIDPVSFDEKDVAEVTVIPKESEFGCCEEDNDKDEDILTAGGRIFNSENTCLIVDGDIPDSKFHQIEVVEEISVDSVPDGEKQAECKEEYESKLQDLNAKSCCEEGYSLDEIVEDNGNKCIKNIDPASSDEKGLAAVTVILTESEFGCTLRDNERIEDILAESRIINSENTFLLDEEAIPVTKFQLIEIVEEVAVDSISDGVKEDKCGKELKSKLQASLNAKSCQEQGNTVDEIAEDTGKKCASRVVESPNSSMLQEVVLNITVENQTPQSLAAVTGCSGRGILDSHVEPTEKSSTFGNIWLRRGKAASAPQVQATKSRFISTSKVGTEFKLSNVKDVINNPMPKDLSSVFDEEEETFTPSKENLSPNTYHLLFMRKKGKLEETKNSNSQRSQNSKAKSSHNIYSAKRLSTVSNKVNQTPKVAQERKTQRKPLKCLINLAHDQDVMEFKKNRVERVACQSLMNSGGNRKSGTSGLVSAAKSIDGASICGQISNKHTKPSHIDREQKRSWDMVVDTASLLNKESRKALQLLQGLKGTHLIIPRLVIRELSSMKQQFRIFRRSSEASLALEWIEECMEKTRWWIHIQSSMEECMLTAPTSPQTKFIEDSWAFPTVEDHILDCALQYRRKDNVGQFVLLSDNVTLKIKSMAKGLLCETVQQFRQSLVNPFSERFRWPKSSPRGLTWSCQDDLVLRNKYYGLPSKPGLKLITEQF
ncbi:FHA domain-containing protein PS1, partial [Mucuna pruriens]